MKDLAIYYLLQAILAELQSNRPDLGAAERLTIYRVVAWYEDMAERANSIRLKGPEPSRPQKIEKGMK